jgi:hypothetical protein
MAIRLEHPATSPARLAADMTALLPELQLAAELVRKNQNAREELEQYCNILRRLQEVMPRLQVRLTLESVRLRSKQGHSAAAANWATTSKITL